MISLGVITGISIAMVLLIWKARRSNVIGDS